MKLVFLGTASMVPTRERNHFSILARLEKENILIDCGEGTQRQLRIANIAPPRITRVFITHWHGDHFFGLPGLIENLAKNQYDKILHIYGPKGTKKNMERMLDSFFLRNKTRIKVEEINRDGVFLEEEEFTASAAYLKHSVPCLGYSIKERDITKINLDFIKKHKIPKGPVLGDLQRGKDIIFEGKKIRAKDATYLKIGKKATFLIDTSLCSNCYKLAKDSDLLVCDSTYSSGLKDKAKEYMHLISKEAAEIAKKSKSKKLILTHFSQRYKEVLEMEKEAREIFRNTAVSNDFSIFEA